MQAFEKGEVWPRSGWTERPTLEAQINFIRGGIILAVRAAHSVADGHGLLIITNVWAAYCRGEDGSILLGSDSLDRGRLMSGAPANLREFDTYEYNELPPSRKQASEHGWAHAFVKSGEWVSTRMRTTLVTALRMFSDLVTYRSMRIAPRFRRPIDEGTRQTAIFFFSAARLRELKDAVTACGDPEGQAMKMGWPSTHDAVVSLLWGCITRIWKDARYFDRDSNPSPLRRLRWQMAQRNTQPISVLVFWLNGRRLIQDPPLKSYIGNVILLNFLGGPFDDVRPTMEAWLGTRTLCTAKSTSMTRLI